MSVKVGSSCIFPCMELLNPLLHQQLIFPMFLAWHCYAFPVSPLSVSLLPRVSCVCAPVFLSMSAQRPASVHPRQSSHLLLLKSTGLCTVLCQIAPSGSSGIAQPLSVIYILQCWFSCAQIVFTSLPQTTLDLSLHHYTLHQTSPFLPTPTTCAHLPFPFLIVKPFDAASASRSKTLL